MRALAVLVLAVGLAAPAVGDTAKTVLIKDGKTVDSFFMRSGEVDGYWVLDGRTIVMLNPKRDYYMISLKEDCHWIDRYEGFRFIPALGGNMRSGRTYELRDKNDRICDIAAIREVESLDEAKAIAGR